MKFLLIFIVVYICSDISMIGICLFDSYIESKKSGKKLYCMKSLLRSRFDFLNTNKKIVYFKDITDLIIKVSGISLIISVAAAVLFYLSKIY